MSERAQDKNQGNDEVPAANAQASTFQQIVRAAAMRQAGTEAARAEANSDRLEQVRRKSRRIAEEAERNRLFAGTNPAEVLGEAGAQLCAEFLHFMVDKSAGREMRLGKLRGRFSRVLPADDPLTVRAYRIGYVSHDRKPPYHANYQLYLCSDNKLRVYKFSNSRQEQTIINVPLLEYTDGADHMPAQIGYYDPASVYYENPIADGPRGPQRPSGPYYRYVHQTLEDRLGDLAAAAERRQHFHEIVGQGPLSGYDEDARTRAMTMY